ncbi:zinc-binding dehydrogenase [Nonomuraea sp. NPDC004186]
MPSWTCGPDPLEDAGQVDVVFDVTGGDILDRSAALVRAGGTLVSPPTVRPRDGQTIFFVVEPDRARPADLARRVRDGRLRPIAGAVRTLAEVLSAFAAAQRAPGKTIIRVAAAE